MRTYEQTHPWITFELNLERDLSQKCWLLLGEAISKLDHIAEHAHAGTRCGTGWTRGRAYRDLARHLNSDPRKAA